MKLNLLSLTCLFIGLLVSCDPVDNKLVLYNKSQETVSYFFSADSTDETAVRFYSDKFYITPENKKINKEYDYIRSGVKKNLLMIGSWDNYLTKQFKNGTAFLYVIDSIDIGKNRDTLKDTKFIRKYEMSIVYMKENNWQFAIQ